jgi:hypothetical protein
LRLSIELASKTSADVSTLVSTVEGESWKCHSHSMAIDLSSVITSKVIVSESQPERHGSGSRKTIKVIEMVEGRCVRHLSTCGRWFQKLIKFNFALTF